MLRLTSKAWPGFAGNCAAVSKVYSPSDEDVYLRPIVNYKASDQLMYEVGSNVFLGDERHTFFNQFHYNTNLYLAVRYSF